MVACMALVYHHQQTYTVSIALTRSLLLCVLSNASVYYVVLIQHMQQGLKYIKQPLIEGTPCQ